MKKGVPLHSLLRENGGSPGAEETMPGHMKDGQMLKTGKVFADMKTFP